MQIISSAETARRTKNINREQSADKAPAVHGTQKGQTSRPAKWRELILSAQELRCMYTAGQCSAMQCQKIKSACCLESFSYSIFWEHTSINSMSTLLKRQCVSDAMNEWMFGATSKRWTRKLERTGSTLNRKQSQRRQKRVKETKKTKERNRKHTRWMCIKLFALAILPRSTWSITVQIHSHRHSALDGMHCTRTRCEFWIFGSAMKNEEERRKDHVKQNGTKKRRG